MLVDASLNLDYGLGFPGRGSFHLDILGWVVWGGILSFCMKSNVILAIDMCQFSQIKLGLVSLRENRLTLTVSFEFFLFFVQMISWEKLIFRAPFSPLRYSSITLFVFFSVLINTGVSSTKMFFLTFSATKSYFLWFRRVVI